MHTLITYQGTQIDSLIQAVSLLTKEKSKETDQDQDGNNDDDDADRAEKENKEAEKDIGERM